MESPAELQNAGYHSIIQLPVLWGDQDAFGHVNNTIPIRWFESSRIAYLEHSGMIKLLEQIQLGPILAAIRCNYKRQLRYPDTIWVGGKITRLGNSSLDMAHAVWSEHWQAIAAEGDSTIVVFDYAANKPRRVPVQVREAIAAFEQRPDLAK
jgi:acyl-CoA thioester hydrolase